MERVLSCLPFQCCYQIDSNISRSPTVYGAKVPLIRLSLPRYFLVLCELYLTVIAGLEGQLVSQFQNSNVVWYTLNIRFLLIVLRS